MCVCVFAVWDCRHQLVYTAESGPGHRWEDGRVLIIWHVIPSNAPAQPPVHMEERNKEFAVQSDLTDSLLYCLARPVPSIARWHLIMHLSQQALKKSATKPKSVTAAQRRYITVMNSWCILFFFFFLRKLLAYILDFSGSVPFSLQPVPAIR